MAVSVGQGKSGMLAAAAEEAFCFLSTCGEGRGGERSRFLLQRAGSIMPLSCEGILLAIDNYSQQQDNANNSQRTVPAMFVCLCHNVTDGQIQQTMREHGLVSLREVREHLGVGSQCGRCAQCAKQVIATELERQCAAGQCRRSVPIAVAA